MPRDVHKTAQTAFRLPGAVLARLRAAAARSDETMTDIMVRAAIAELDRLDGITTRVTTTEPVSPPRPPRKPREDTAPGAAFVAASEPQSSRPAHRPSCKCGMCKPGASGTGGKP
jgi:hypothetical protein